MGKPGVIFYYDMLVPLKAMTFEDIGRLTVAMLEYGSCGRDPNFEGLLAIVWGFVKPKMDRDAVEYDKAILKRQYATACRERKKRGDPEITFDDWLLSTTTNDDQSNHVISHDINYNYNPNYNPNYNCNDNSSCSYNDNDEGAEGAKPPATAGENTVRVVGGELGKNVVFLSDEQTDDLLGRMDIQTFDYYVDKLSTFIIKNDARVKNHYETILKWWKEDGKVSHE